MNNIICPNCHKAFEVDETGYSNILKQVHNQEFENKLNCTAKESEIIPAPPNGLFLSKVNYPYLKLPESESVCAMMKLGF